MFKGTEKYPREAFTRTIKRYGGRDNGFTGRDFTAYYQVFEKSRLSVSFDLESDRMINLILKPQDFAKEHDVVREERRLRVDDRPESKLFEQLHSVALDNSPYRQPVVGWMADIDGIELDDLERWYRQWYAPNNATLVVVGDVNPAEVFEQAREYFGAIPPRDLPPRKARSEARQEGERRTVVAIPAVQAHLAIGYRVPRVGAAEKQWHPYALMVLAEVLGGGRSSRFERKLVRGAAIAQHVGVSYDSYGRHDGLFYISAAPVVGITAAQLERSIEREIEALHDGMISDEELATVKAGIVSHEVFSRDSIRHQAYMLGSFETIGAGWEELFKVRGKIEAVTAEQVREVARRYLLRDNRTVGVLDPQPPEKK